MRERRPVMGHAFGRSARHHPTTWCCPLTDSSSSERTPGASTSIVRVTNVNVNRMASDGAGGGVFELLVVTEDRERHILTPLASDAIAQFAIVNASPVLLWDSENRTLIAADIMANGATRLDVEDHIDLTTVVRMLGPPIGGRHHGPGLPRGGGRSDGVSSGAPACAVGAAGPGGLRWWRQVPML